jgi:hypothetical protein
MCVCVCVCVCVCCVCRQNAHLLPSLESSVYIMHNMAALNSGVTFTNVQGNSKTNLEGLLGGFAYM